jgi:hypothetical protein
MIGLTGNTAFFLPLWIIQFIPISLGILWLIQFLKIWD